MGTSFGTLYIVATPLGNLKDISFRAVEILQTVQLIAAEDTRHSVALLKNFSIKTPIISLHEHNERERTAQLIDRLRQGESIALISDAGTPLLSDPGYFLVNHAQQEGIAVSPIPGACAAIAALSVAGLPTDRFVFEGFLPAKPKLRQARLQALKTEPRTMIFYEAPHRIVDFLQSLEEALGATRPAMFARELTKLFETTRLSTVAELSQWVINDKNQQRGEMVIVVAGAPAVTMAAETDGADILPILLDNLPLKQAVEVAAQITKGRKNELYEKALQLQKNKGP